MWKWNYFWIYSIFFQGIIHFAGTASLRCHRGSLYVYLMTPLESPWRLLHCLDRSLPTVVYTFGYTGRTTGLGTSAVLSAYIATRKRNVVLLDWEEEARSGALGLQLGYVVNAVPNAKMIGYALGDALSKLSNAGLNLNQLHLLGHSLGAHVMAYAGRRARANGHVVDRITGLDPSRILFEGELSLQPGLDYTCARFVDIIHTDPGGYGTSESKGTVDIWPNYFSGGRKQPGCGVGNYALLNRNDLCSHDRSWQFFVEALSYPTAFPATSRSNRAVQRIYLGDLIDRRARGDYFLATNSRSPYGKYEEGLRLVPTQGYQQTAAHYSQPAQVPYLNQYQQSIRQFYSFGHNILNQYQYLRKILPF